MNFFSLELCQEMQKAGLISESGFWWFKEGKLFDDDSDSFHIVYEDDEVFDCFVDRKHCVAFTAFDLIAPTETARNNASLWWGKGKGPFSWWLKVHEIIDLDTTKESVEDYVKRTRRKE